MRRFLTIALLVIVVCPPFSSAASQQPDVGVWFGISPAHLKTSAVERFEIERQSVGVAILWAPFGKTSVSSGIITLRPDSSIEFNWAGRPSLVCALRRADSRNYEGACRGPGQLERQLTLTRNMQPNGFEVSVSDTDFRILEKARQILSGPSVWNRHDDRACEDDAKQNSWSLFCALYQASMDVAGSYLPSRPVMSASRGAVGEVRNGQEFQHLLMDYNNLESTTYADIAAAFERTARRLLVRKTCTAPSASAWSTFERVTSSNLADARETEAGQAFWNEPIAYTVRSETYRLNTMVGPTTSSGSAPSDWVTSSTAITRRTWKLNEFEGVDVKGELRNGNQWRYFGQCGEFLSYHDVPSEAAAYFDHIIDGVFFSSGRRAPLH